MPPEYAFSPGSSIDTNIVNRIYRVQVQMSPNEMQTPMQRMPKREVKPEVQLPGKEQEIYKAEAIEQAPQKRVESEGDLRIGGIPVKRMGKANVPAQVVAPPVARKKIGRNDPCPCGSGKKYKKCHYPQYG